MRTEHWIILLTFVGGFFLFFLFSLGLNACWLDSPYHFPFLLHPTILIGDSLLLPLFNYRFYKFLRTYFAKNPLSLKTFLSPIWGSLAILLSLAINTFTHYTWIHDSYTGFMDTVIGKLSLAGWWHYCFSTIQTAIILMFLGFWFMTLKRKIYGAFQYAFRTWNLCVVFFVLRLLDRLVMYSHMELGKGLGQFLIRDWGLLPLYLAFLILVIAGNKERFRRHHFFAVIVEQD